MKIYLIKYVLLFILFYTEWSSKYTDRKYNQWFYTESFSNYINRKNNCSFFYSYFDISYHL